MITVSQTEVTGRGKPELQAPGLPARSYGEKEKTFWQSEGPSACLGASKLT